MTDACGKRLQQTQRRLQPPPNPVANDRAADFFRHGETEARRSCWCLPARSTLQGEAPRIETPPFGDIQEIASPAQAVSSAEGLVQGDISSPVVRHGGSAHRGHAHGIVRQESLPRSRSNASLRQVAAHPNELGEPPLRKVPRFCRRGSGTQALTAAGASRGYNFAAAHRGHSGPKSVPPLTHELARLICPLQCSHPSSEDTSSNSPCWTSPSFSVLPSPRSGLVIRVNVRPDADDHDAMPFSAKACRPRHRRIASVRKSCAGTKASLPPRSNSIRPFVV